MLALASLFIKNVHTTPALFYSSTKMGIQEFQAVNTQTPGQMQVTQYCPLTFIRWIGRQCPINYNSSRANTVWVQTQAFQTKITPATNSYSGI